MFKLEMDTNNAAFQSDREGVADENSEIARILREVADDFDYRPGYKGHADTSIENNKHNIIDFNGNVVGHFQLTQD